MVCLKRQPLSGAPRHKVREDWATRPVKLLPGWGKCKRIKSLSLPERFWVVGGIAMYAVIRAGGKQYRVAPGDVIEIEKLSQDGNKVQFDDILAVSGKEGELAKPSKAFVTGEVLEHGRADKILVFHYKRKKQYKKLNGHRQPYTAVKITGISVNGQELKA
jgi:large subunit ribosomal protein L21